MSDTCPNCDSKNIKKINDKIEIAIKGQYYKLPKAKIMICNECKFMDYID